MQIILNEIALQKEWEHLMTNNRVWTKKVKTQQQQTKKDKNIIESFVSAGNRARDIFYRILHNCS